VLNTGVACCSGAVTWFNALEALSAATVAAKKTRKSHDAVWAVEEASKQLSILDLEYLVDRELQPFRHANVFPSSLFERLCRLFDGRST